MKRTTIRSDFILKNPTSDELEALSAAIVDKGGKVPSALGPTYDGVAEKLTAFQRHMSGTQRIRRRIDPITNVLGGEPALQKAWYAATVEHVEKAYKNNKLSDSEYFGIISEIRKLVDPIPVNYGPLERPPRRNLANQDSPYVYARRRGKFVKMPQSVLRELENATGSGVGKGYNLMTVKRLLKSSVDSSKGAKVCGVALYAVGLLLGQYVGTEVQDNLAKYLARKQRSDADKAKSAADAAATDSKNKLLQTLSFTLMTRRTGDTTAPAPVAVLRSASINRGLVLGVSISNPL